MRPTTTPFTSRDGQLLGVRDDMIVGDDIAGGIDDETGAKCHRLFPWISGWILEEAPQKLIEWCSTRHGGHEAAVALCVGILPGGLFGQLDRDIDDRRQHVLG